MRAIFFSINDMGLGHLRRSAAILLSLRSIVPELKPLIITNAHYERLLRVLKVPAVILPMASNAPRNDVDQLRARVPPEVFDEIALRVIQAYHPEVIVFDTYVGPRLASRFSRHTAHSCLVFRKCTPERFMRYVRANYFCNFELVLIPHGEDEFKASLPTAFLEAFEQQSRVVYVGPVVFPKGMADDHSPASTSSPGEKLVLLLGGGGGYDAIQSKFFARAKEAVQGYARRTSLPVNCLTVAGPFTSAPSSSNDPAVVLGPVNVRDYIERADLVICHGGYNTVNEVLASRARAIFCPFYRKTEDQLERVGRLRNRPGTLIVSPNIAVDELENAVGAALASPRPNAQEFHGATNAARQICDLATSGQVDIIKVLWSEVPELVKHPMLPTAEIHVRLNWGDCATLSRRAYEALEQLESIGVEQSEVSMSFEDRDGGAQLPAMVRLLLGRRLKSLTAFVSGEEKSDRVHIYHYLEDCRLQQPHFRFEIARCEA